MSKILGNQQTIEYARNAAGTSKDVHVNFDAINELPDEFEVVITEVTYDPQKLDARFYDIGNGKGPYLPRPEMMYEIGIACGIKGGATSESCPEFAEVDWNRLAKPGDIAAPPEMVKIQVGHRVTKFSTRMIEDGTEIPSSPCTVIYNAWARCLELWSKEEKFTEGYTKQGRYQNKYQTPYDRRAHFDGEMKHAASKAETKAQEKTIRELANLMTGYEKADLTSGRLVFSRVQRSREVLRMETAARLTAITRGGSAPAEATEALFGSEAAGSLPMPQAPEPSFDIEEPQAPPSAPAAPKPWEAMRDALASYLGEGFVQDEHAGEIKGIIAWVSEQGESAEKAPKWKNCVEWLHFIESNVPEGQSVDHGIPRG